MPTAPDRVRRRLRAEGREPAEVAGRAMRWLDDVLKSLGVEDRPRWEMHLAVDEVVTNVARHAYAPGAMRCLSINATRTPRELRVVVSDNGAPFDPLRHVRVPAVRELEDTPVGGLGIYLATQAVDRIRYRRHAGRNTLTLVKRL